MHQPLPQDHLTATAKALEAAGITMALLKRVPALLKHLADQTLRAATSVPANLAEGHGRFGRDRIHHWRIAYGSAKEVDVFLRLLATARSIDRHQARTALDLFDQVRAMTWCLIHPKKF
ncbi:MAG: four helix bundle protein [bacterium]|nr:four helix bundle protein [bacterium]